MSDNRFDFTDRNHQPDSDSPFYSEYEPQFSPDKKIPERPVEVPLPNKIKLSDLIILLSLIVVCVMGLISNLSESFPFMDLFLPFICMFVAIILSPFIDRHMLGKVCTVHATGKLVGYATRQRYSRWGNYDVYAPKYEIFVNGRYEIRTLDDFSQTYNFPTTMELLVNPDGYEIMPADKSIRRSGKKAIISSVILLILMLLFLLPALHMRSLLS